MNATQRELFAPRPKRDLVDDGAQLAVWLRGKGWQTAAAIERALGFDDRYMRRIANASRGHVISGQEGYRLTLEASLPEIDHARNALLSQARDMERRAIEIDRVRHGRISRGDAVAES